jgi:hypothetical protein
LIVLDIDILTTTHLLDVIRLTNIVAENENEITVIIEIKGETEAAIETKFDIKAETFASSSTTMADLIFISRTEIVEVIVEIITTTMGTTATRTTIINNGHNELYIIVILRFLCRK